MSRMRSLVGQFLRYALVGASGVLVNLAIFTVLVAMESPVLLAAVCSGIFSWGGNLLLNRYWTFRSRHPLHVEAARYLAVSLVALTLNLALLTLFAGWGLAPVLAQAAALVLVGPLSFVASRTMVFASPVAPGPQ